MFTDLNKVPLGLESLETLDNSEGIFPLHPAGSSLVSVVCEKINKF